MPDVGSYDTETDWMHACVPAMMDEGREQEQAVAACLSMWRRKEEDGDKATWTTAYINNLPDGSFLYIEPGQDKDEEGKTVPRSARHFPYKGADGAVDLPHLRNAIQRIPQSNAPGLSADKKRQLQDRARKILEDASKTKAGRRLRGDWLKKLKDLKAAAEAWLKGMSDMEAWAAYADDEDEDEDKPGCKTAPMLFKAKDGKTWLLTWTTNAFIDRDKELFSTKSIEEYVARHEGDETKGKFELWHLPGTEFGTIRWQAPVGRFLVEAGPFDATPVGEKAKAFFEAYPDGHESHAPEGWATSHGYSFREGDRDDGVYDWFEKQETSVLPFEYAANQHNPPVEVVSMDEKQKALAREIFGDEMVQAIIAKGEAQTKALEAQGIAYKANEEKPTEKPAETPAPAPAPAPAVDIKAIMEGLHLNDLDQTLKTHEAGMKELSEMVKSLQAELAEVKKQDEKRVAEKMADIPRFSWFRGSQAASTVLSEDNPQDAALKAKKPTPGAIQAIAAKMGGGS